MYLCMYVCMYAVNQTNDRKLKAIQTIETKLKVRCFGSKCNTSNEKFSDSTNIVFVLCANKAKSTQGKYQNKQQT